MIDNEVEKIIKYAHEKATKLLTENKSKLDNMARLLIERETIYQDEVDMIMDGKSATEIMKIMEDKDGAYAENPFVRVDSEIAKEEIEKAVEEKVEEEKKALETNE